MRNKCELLKKTIEVVKCSNVFAVVLIRYQGCMYIILALLNKLNYFLFRIIVLHKGKGFCIHDDHISAKETADMLV